MNRCWPVRNRRQISVPTPCDRGAGSRTVKECPMESSYPYSPPQMPGRRILEDMIVWYATMDTRVEALKYDI